MGNAAPLVTVLIPAYNHERYVQESIMSVLAQDWPRIELVVIDDGSTDATWSKICSLKETCEKTLERVVFRTKQNEGTCRTMNLGLSMAHGEYVLLCASDDRLLPGAIGALIGPMLVDLEIGLTVGQNLLIDATGARIYWDNRLNPVYERNKATYESFSDHFHRCFQLPVGSPDFGRYETFLKYNHVANGYLIRRSCLELIGPFRSEAPLEDYWMHLQLSKITRYLEIPQATFEYRWHAANTAKRREHLYEMARKTLRWEWERNGGASAAESFCRKMITSRKIRRYVGCLLWREDLAFSYFPAVRMWHVLGRRWVSCGSLPF